MRYTAREVSPGFTRATFYDKHRHAKRQCSNVKNNPGQNFRFTFHFESDFQLATSCISDFLQLLQPASSKASFSGVSDSEDDKTQSACKEICLDN